jgi:hypothetical protein
MREVITFRNFKERECGTIAELVRLACPPFPKFRVAVA